MYNFSRLENDAREAISKLQKRIDECNSRIEDLPSGSLEVSHRLQKDYYTHYQPDSEKKRSGITRKDELVKQLATKEYYQKQLNKSILQLNILQGFVNSFDFHTDDNLLGELTDWKHPLVQTEQAKIYEKIKGWEQADYKTNSYKQDTKNIKAQKGILVRSKSEREIANCLYAAKIPFRYEAELLVNGEYIYPDFTIMHPETGEIYYWEHAGMIDTAEYANNNYKRFAQYASIGAYLGENLIFTTEDKVHPLETELIEKLIDFYFK